MSRMPGSALAWLVAAAGLLVSAATCGPASADRPDRGGAGAAAGDESAPRLVVVIVHDQFRDDYLERFRPFFCAGGFRRLVSEGARFTDCTIPYAPTLTAPGHATLGTGATPSQHGIIGNGWYDRRAGAYVECDEDARGHAVPRSASSAGSPVRLRAQTVGDVLRGATLGAGKVIAVSEKSRSAILPAGHHPTAAYWLDEMTGLMQTSSYYVDRLPAWVEAANAARRPERAADRAWTPLLPARAYRGTVVADGAPSFPHSLSAGRRAGGLSAFTTSPWALERTYEFARRAVIGEGLGADGVPDLLFLSLSVTDRVGHLFGPYSPEVMDMAVRADRELARFLRFLDARVGRRYALVLTSDHGAAPVAPSTCRHEAVSGDSLGPISDSSFAAWVNGTLDAAWPGASRAAGRPWLEALGEGSIWLDAAAAAEAGVTSSRAASALADSARSNPWLAAAYASGELAQAGAADPIAEKVRRGFFPAHGGELLFVLRPYVLWGGPRVRGDHGTPYSFDAHVPLVLYGRGVRRGVYREPVSTVDIAPTVSAILGIERPAQCEGRPLFRALEVRAWR